MLGIEFQGTDLYPVNINNSCFIEAREDALDFLRRHWADRGVVTDAFARHFLDTTPLGIRQSIWQLMNVFWPLFYEGFENSPFQSVTMQLDPSPKISKEHSLKTVSINDFIYMRLTADGSKRVSYTYPQRGASRTPFEMISLPFHAAIFIFGPECYMGNPVQHIVKNTLYLPG